MISLWRLIAKIYWRVIEYYMAMKRYPIDDSAPFLHFLTLQFPKAHLVEANRIWLRNKTDTDPQ